MAPQPIHAAPHVQLAQLALAARARGERFSDFWRIAVREDKPVVMTTTADPPAGAVRWPTDPSERKAWRAAIVDSRAGWKRAYERQDAPVCEQALGLLGDSIGALEVVAYERADDELDSGLAQQEALRSAA